MIRTLEDNKTSENDLIPKENQVKPHESSTDAVDFGDVILRHHDKTYSRKFKFDRAQFTQCIPNPAIEKEFITVQIASDLLKPAGGLDTPLNKLPLIDRQQGRLYQNYEFIKTNANKHESEAKLFPTKEAVSMFSDAPSKDQKGIKVSEYMETRRTEHNEEYAARIAIIAFW